MSNYHFIFLFCATLMSGVGCEAAIDGNARRNVVFAVKSRFRTNFESGRFCCARSDSSAISVLLSFYLRRFSQLNPNRKISV